MRVSTTPQRDDAKAAQLFEAALDAGVSVFDTAHAYGLDEHDLGHNERVLGEVLRRHPRGASALVVTKAGMRRDGGRWIPDGRASTLRAHAEASLHALGRPIDLLLLHAPDPRVPLETSVRALRQVLDEGLVRAIGLSNVTRPQLKLGLQVAPLAAVQLGFSVLDDAPLKGGVVDLAVTHDLTVLAHSPLGGPKKVRQLEQVSWLVEGAKAAGCTPYEWALAALLSIDQRVVVLPGARRVETLQSSRRAEHVVLPEVVREVMHRSASPTPTPSPPGGGEVVLIMGVQGAGKSTLVAAYEARGFVRLNRDTQGGTLKQLNEQLKALLAQGQRRVVLDNTYVTRAQRRDVIDVAHAAGVSVRGVWLEVSNAQAELNITRRMVAAHRRLLEPDELRRGKEPTQLSPQALLRTLKQVEVVEAEEGFDAIESVPYVERPEAAGAAATFFGLELVDTHSELIRSAEGLRFVVGWSETVNADQLGVSEVLLCRHGGGPASCWCRPPLPGLLVEVAQRRGLQLSKCVVVTSSNALQKLAATVGARCISP